MAISRKPRPINAQSVDIEALINKGGTPSVTVSSKTAQGANKSVPVVLRLPGDMIEQIDTVLKARPVRTPRHTWLLEAAHEKLIREQNG